MIQLILFAIVLLIPSAIEDPQEPKMSPEPVASTPLVVPPIKKSTASRPAWLPRDKVRFNREAFIREFENQATEALLICVRAAIAEKGSATFLARMQRDGRMTALRMISPSLAMPTCAHDAMAAMRFNPQRLEAQDRDVEIEWRYDW